MDKKTELKGRPPGRKLTKGDLAKVTGGSEILHGCCSQGCCDQQQFASSKS
ncbi:MAG TPA: hypothetical protein VJ725_25820 [Thermoanaerobaculia bacterium]|nr:hypothetical protein [Thermoanaerobaculia bacterium]